MGWRNKKSKLAKSNKDNNNRIKIIMSIIFISGALVISKLVQLQIISYQKYKQMADRQQQSKGVLTAQRGRIFIQDEPGDGVSGELYPLASNKGMGTIFAKPNAVKDPLFVAESLYDLLDKEKAIKAVDELMLTDEALKLESEDFKKVKRELELQARRERTIANYLSLLSKTDDPYERIASRVDEDELKILKELKLPGIDYTLETNRYYPEKNIASHITGFVGYVGDKKQGRYGLEGFFEKELSGTDGYMKADRNALGELVVMNDKDYIRPINGSDLILTINRSMQFEACGKLKEYVLKHGASGGSVIIMEPNTGAILTMCSYPDFDPNDYQSVKESRTFNSQAIFGNYEPGSTFKSITMAAALDQEKVAPNSTFDDKGFVMVEGWPKPIKNSDYETAGGHGRTDMNTVLEKSLNTGVVFAMNKVGASVFSDYVKKFGFGEKTGIELETESAGNIANIAGKKIRPVNAATASFGQGISVTPLQMVTSYAAIANGGMLMKPYVVKAVVSPSREKNSTNAKQLRRVISNRASTLLGAMLTNAVENGHAKRAQVPGYFVAGKTGTAQVAIEGTKGYSEQYIHSFIGFAPANNPRFVMLTRLDDPKDAKFAESTAVPLFGDIAKFVLNYLHVPLERKAE